jgi:hypothetical protein
MEPPAATIMLQYEGNSSKMWDGKWITQTGSYLIELGYGLQELQPGNLVELPWPQKGKNKGRTMWKAVVVDDDASKLQVNVSTQKIFLVISGKAEEKGIPKEKAEDKEPEGQCPTYNMHARGRSRISMRGVLS